MHDRLSHHLYDRPLHQFIVMRHNLTAGEGEGSKEIKFAYNPQHLSVFHHWKGIEVGPNSRMAVCRFTVTTGRVTNCPAVHARKPYIARPVPGLFSMSQFPWLALVRTYKRRTIPRRQRRGNLLRADFKRLRFWLFLFLRLVCRPAYYDYHIGDEVHLRSWLDIYRHVCGEA